MAQSCKISSTPKGMQIQNELPTENTDMPSFPNLGNTVDISGIVAELEQYYTILKFIPKKKPLCQRSQTQHGFSTQAILS